METRRWTNPTQPQTMQIAVYLLYINAVLSALFGAIVSPIGLVLVIGQAAAGFGIANERRWGYWLGVAIATLGLVPFVLAVLDGGLGVALSFGFIISLLMPAALFALLLHPTSREYQRVWFT
jgi:membrane-associated protease RseP (regulator of RpoE activity)